MINAWNVMWQDQGKKFKKSFEGDSPRDSGAIPYGKKLQSRGIQNVEIVSRRRAFPPPVAKRNPPKLGMLWCPYCLKWREFREFAVQRPDFKAPLLFRCPVCTISISDPYVRRYNPIMSLRLSEKTKKVASEKLIRRRAATGK